MVSKGRIVKSADIPLRICVVGSGPAGFYFAKRILKIIPNSTVDMIERSLLPFGLLRDGVAPDNQPVRNYIQQLEKHFEYEPRFKFLGNVDVGRNVTYNQLSNFYHTSVLTLGARSHKRLQVTGMSLPGIFSGVSFAGWYNGSVEHSSIQPDLTSNTVVIIGNGNVALDVARIILSPRSKLEVLDIPMSVVDKLEILRQNVKRVFVVGRRSVHQSSFSVKELRSTTTIPGVRVFRSKDHPCLSPQHHLSSEYLKSRLFKLISSFNQFGSETVNNFQEEEKENGDKQLIFLSDHTPIEYNSINNNNKLSHVFLQQIQPSFQENKIVYVPTDSKLEIETSLCIECIGCSPEIVFPAESFDKESGGLNNIQGRIPLESSGSYLGNFCSGWLKTGGKGDLVKVIGDVEETAASLKFSFDEIYQSRGIEKKDELQEYLIGKSVKTTNFDDWKSVNRLELQRGRDMKKVRERLTSLTEIKSHLNI